MIFRHLIKVKVSLRAFLVGVLPLLAMHGIDPLPPDARAWLVVLASLTVLGTCMQGLLSAAPRTPRPAPARRDAPAPESTAAAA